jgi:hypothetical protein
MAYRPIFKIFISVMALAALLGLAVVVGIAPDASARPAVRDHRACAPNCVVRGPPPRPGSGHYPKPYGYPTPPRGYHPPK